jgi:hypothetical protein
MGLRPRAYVLVVAAALALGLTPRAARADERLECANAYEQTQRAQQRATLLAALEDAERCARPTCPSLLSTECTRWTSEIKSKIPRLVIRVRASDGCTRDGAHIEISGSSRKEIEGGAETILVDPGVHHVKVIDPLSERWKIETMDFGAGERRDIDVDFGAESATCGPPPKPEAPPPKAVRTSLVLGAIGGGLLVTGMGLGVVGAVKRSDLDSCKPACDQDRIDAVRPFFVAGDVIGAVGLLTIGAGVVVWYVLERKDGRRTSAFDPASWLRASF